MILEQEENSCIYVQFASMMAHISGSFFVKVFSDYIKSNCTLAYVPQI